jgi:hypothetical protein
MEITITPTSGVTLVEVPEDIAKDFQETYEALRTMPVNNMANVDFPEADYTATEKLTAADQAAKAARLYVRQGKAWAASQEVVIPITDDDGNVTGSRTSALVFTRKGDVKGNPTRVSFRIYVPRAKDETETEAE